MASLSDFSGPSSESEQVFVSAGKRGRWSGWRLIWVLRRLLTAFRELQVLGGNEGSASRSEIRPWASPITAMSTTTLVLEDWKRENRHREWDNHSLFIFSGANNKCHTVVMHTASLSLYLGGKEDMFVCVLETAHTLRVCTCLYTKLNILWHPVDVL